MFSVDNTSKIIDINTINKCTYLKHNFENKCERLDISPHTLDILIKKINDPEIVVDSYINKIMYSTKCVTEADFCKIIIKNATYYISNKKLKKSTVLANLLNNKKEIILKSQTSTVFNHIIELLRNSKYNFPEEYETDIKMFLPINKTHFKEFASSENFTTLFRKPDLYLTGNPQITLFKKIYSRYEEFTTGRTIMKANTINDNTHIFIIETENVGYLGNMYLKYNSATLNDIISVNLYAQNKQTDEIIEFENKSIYAIQMDIDVNLACDIYYEILEQGISCIPFNFGCTKTGCNLVLDKLMNYNVILKVECSSSNSFTKLHLFYDRYKSITPINTTFSYSKFITEKYNFDNHKLSIPLFSIIKNIKNIAALLFYVQPDKNSTVYVSPNEKNMIIDAEIRNGTGELLFHTDPITSLHTFASLGFCMKYLMKGYYIINFCVKNPNDNQHSGTISISPDYNDTLTINTKCKNGEVWIGVYERKIIELNDGILEVK
jgi:hypothetical protein